MNFKNLIKNRPESANLNVALCDKPADVHFTMVNEAYAVNGIWEFMPSFIKEKWFSTITDAWISTQPTIPCRPILPLLTALGVMHIDLWVLDVEGAELLVLQSMDFGRVTVDVLIFELDGSNSVKDQACIDLLDKAGYEEVGCWQGSVISRNKWFQRRGFIQHSELNGFKHKFTGNFRRASGGKGGR